MDKNILRQLGKPFDDLLMIQSLKQGRSPRLLRQIRVSSPASMKPCVCMIFHFQTWMMERLI